MHHSDHTQPPGLVPQSPNEPESESSLQNAAALEEAYQLDQFRVAILAKTPIAIFTAVFLLANLIVFVVLGLNGVSWLQPTPQVMIEWGANYAPKTLDGELWRLGSCMFLHYGIIHIGMNMLALWNLGTFVERLFGNAGFCVLYLLSGLAGSLASACFNPVAAGAGASGAIFGVAGALLGGTWKLRHSLPRPFIASGKWVAVNIVILFVVFSVINQSQKFGMIDNSAHLGGLLTGLVCGLIMAEPIPNPGRSRRLLRNSLALILGTGGLVGAINLLPPAPASLEVLEKLETNYMRVEQEVNREFASLENRRKVRAITREAYALEMEAKILVPWRALREEFEAVKNVPEPYRKVIGSLQKVIELRQSGWELWSEGIREDDPAKLQEGNRLLEEAYSIVKELNEQTKAKQAEAN